MTVSTTSRRAGPYVGNDVTVAFPFTFRVFEDTDVLVVRARDGAETELTLTTDYTVSVNADQDNNPGGTVTMVTAPSADDTLVFTSQVEATQDVTVTNAGGFFPAVFNAVFDRLTILVQQVLERMDRSLKLAITTDGVDTTLPPASAGALIGFNAAADGFDTYDPADIASAYAEAQTYFDTFTGTGAQTAFTLSAAPAHLNALIVAVNGVLQRPTTHYTLSGTTLTFVSAPANAARVDAIYTQPSTRVTFPSLGGNNGKILSVVAGVMTWVNSALALAGTWTGTLIGQARLSSIITPSQITSNQNDYAPTGYADASIYRITSDAARAITGLAGGASGLIKVLFNVGNFAITLSSESASSLAANRFFFVDTSLIDRVLAPGMGIVLIYDSTSSRWREAFQVSRARSTDLLAGTDDYKHTTPKNFYDAAASVAASDAASITLDGNSGWNRHVTLGDNRTLANPTNFKAGQSGRIRIIQDGTGGRTLSYGTAWAFPGGAPALSTAAGAIDVITYFVHDPAAADGIECRLSRGFS